MYIVIALILGGMMLIGDGFVIVASWVIISLAVVRMFGALLCFSQEGDKLRAYLRTVILPTYLLGEVLMAFPVAIFINNGWLITAFLHTIGVLMEMLSIVYSLGRED